MEYRNIDLTIRISGWVKPYLTRHDIKRNISQLYGRVPTIDFSTFKAPPGHTLELSFEARGHDALAEGNSARDEIPLQFYLRSSATQLLEMTSLVRGNETFTSENLVMTRLDIGWYGSAMTHYGAYARACRIRLSVKNKNKPSSIFGHSISEDTENPVYIMRFDMKNTIIPKLEADNNVGEEDKIEHGSSGILLY